MDELKKIFSFNLKKNNIERLDLLRSEPVTRSELVDYLLEYILNQQNTEFITGCVKILKEQTARKVEECIING